MMENFRKEAWSDVVNTVLGIFLFVSPWIFGFGAETQASWNAMLSGLVVAGLAMAAITAFAEWEEWLNFAAGVWVAVSPWIVGFSTLSTAMYLHLAVGIIVAAVAAVRLWFTHHPPRLTAKS